MTTNGYRSRITLFRGIYKQLEPERNVIGRRHYSNNQVYLILLQRKKYLDTLQL